MANGFENIDKLEGHLSVTVLRIAHGVFENIDKLEGHLSGGAYRSVGR